MKVFAKIKGNLEYLPKAIMRLLAGSMSILISTNSIAFAYPDNNTATSNMNNSKKFTEVLKNNKGKLIAGGALVIAAICGGKALMDYYGLDDIIEKYNCRNYEDVLRAFLGEQERRLSFDDWFEILGGTNADIRGGYRISGLESETGLNAGQRDDLRTINGDVHRTQSLIEFRREENAEILRRILKFSVINGNMKYVQGFDRYAVVAMNKCLREKRIISAEDEAKIYYIYTQIVRTTADNLIENKYVNGESMCRYYREIANLDCFKWAAFPGLEDDGSIITLYGNPYVTGGVDWFTMDQSIKIWDNIIANCEGRFDSEWALRQIATILHAVVLKYWNDKNVSSENDDNNASDEYKREMMMRWGAYIANQMPGYCKRLYVI